MIIITMIATLITILVSSTERQCNCTLAEECGRVTDGAGRRISEKKSDLCY